MVSTIIHTHFFFFFSFEQSPGFSYRCLVCWAESLMVRAHITVYITHYWAFLPNQSIGKIRWQRWLLQSHDLPWCLLLHTTGVTVSHEDKRDSLLFILFSAVIMVFVFIRAGWSVHVGKDAQIFMWNEDSYCSSWGILLPSIEPQRRSLPSFL